MRLFGIESDGSFKEFIRTPFQSNYKESVLEGWLENNPDGIVEDGKLLIIGRQVNTNLGTTIDLIAVDRQGSVVVIELKRDRTPRDTLAQALEYASFAEELDSNQLQDILRSYINDDSVNLSEYHRQYFELATDEAVAFNKDQRIVIAGQAITNEIRQTSDFLRKKGFQVTCVEFSFFEAEGGVRLLSHDIVIGKQPNKLPRVSSGSLPIVSKDTFLDSLDQNGRLVFGRLLGFASSNALPIHWGTKGFSLNYDADGTHVILCIGYPPDAVFKQSIYTALVGQGGLLSKVAVPEDALRTFIDQMQDTGLFIPAGREFKCLINRQFSESEISSLLKWVESWIEIIRRYGLKE
jgi:hypothetical protein